MDFAMDAYLWIFSGWCPATAYPYVLRWANVRLAILTESRRLEMRLLCCGCIDCLAGWFVSCGRKSCPQPVPLSWITGLFSSVLNEVDQNPFRIFLFWAVLNGWTLLISWFWEGIQYVKSEQQLFALGVGDTGEDASPNDGPRQEQCGVWSLLC